ncbi:acyl-CoA dehydrogenase family protein [Roseateles sp. DAIF2]|uniref:acyl-CoA dehydrogenase family protein n=1 Tax=Roseateles sp. DAIF2 TaxID=2714952 RepID=UPI0018A2E84C|nr:acyl-CoA dehydrogenase family protein [Roseateles sp. DAIF2]QPF73602.1 acyl-CoA dehydrogenase family protein [Roseateles sp. DAIF2]
MHADSLNLARQWEQLLGDPRHSDALLHFGASLQEDERELFPQAQLLTLQRMGLFEQLVPRADGGRLDEPERVLLLSRILSRRNLSCAVAFGQSLLGSIPIWLAGSPAQRAAHAASLRAGGLACLALTERAHGSDILATEFEVRAEGEELRLSGEKWLINNGSRGASATVLARQVHADGRSELVLLRLARPDAPAPAWQSLPKIATHGIRGADISGFTLQDHRCAAAEALLPRGEPAIGTVLKTLQISRILCAGFSLGATDTLLRLTLGFAGQRELYGKQVAQIPAARAKLAQSYARLLGADLLAQACTRAIALLPQELSLISPICKYRLPLECEAIARELAVVLGARHYLRSSDALGMFQKMQRDLQVVSLFDGSTQVNLALLAGQLRHLQERLEQPGGPHDAEAARALARQLLRPAAWAGGWPEAGALRLASQGRDSLMLAYRQLRARHEPAADEPMLAATLQRLDRRLQAWLDAVRQALWEERCALDSCRVLALAQDYTRLWHACALALAWQLEQEDSDGGPGGGLDADLLLENLRQALPELEIAGCEARDERLLQRALAALRHPHLFSLSPLPCAW